MGEKKQRSAIFKFFYVILSIITFPVFLLLFILRHPLWLLFVILVCGGIVVYWPMSQNVELKDVASWYQKKYVQMKHDVVIKAVETGKVDLLPRSIVKEVKKMEEDAREAKLPKSENYNQKVVRDAKSEERKALIKKRGGFKKIDDNEFKEDEVEVLSESGTQVGGLSQLLQKDEENNGGQVEDKNSKDEFPAESIGSSGNMPDYIETRPDAVSDEKSNATNDDEFELF